MSLILPPLLLLLLPSPAAGPTVDELLAKVDANGDGDFSVEEVRALIVRGCSAFVHDVDVAPLAQDDDGDGEGCREGWTGEDCDECAPGFGGENCAPLEAEQEEEGCLPGWAGEDCDECAAGFGGDDCTPLGAEDGEDGEDGEDEGCLVGWAGEDCDECAAGFGGDDCTPLGAEDGEDGEEEGCLVGWAGEDCDECAAGFGGDDCTPDSSGEAGEAPAPAPKPHIRTVEFAASPPVLIDEHEPPPAWDPNGYIIAHFCQGRFGNQFDYLLHLLDIAGRTGRTLVLPPYTDYSAQETMGKSPWFWWFGEVFDVEQLAELAAPLKVLGARLTIVHGGVGRRRQLGVANTPRVLCRSRSLHFALSVALAGGGGRRPLHLPRQSAAGVERDVHGRQQPQAPLLGQPRCGPTHRSFCADRSRSECCPQACGSSGRKCWRAPRTG
eukprot:COSAG04_NODE_438_length_14426_cov_10.589795_12_plen_439_part_00